jgi:hypothetical protein
MFTSDSTAASTASASSANFTPAGRVEGDIVERVQRPDTECRARAREYLVDLIGAPPDDLSWDSTHRLRGHAHLGGRELVVIAPRDEAHSTVVLTTYDWDQIRRAAGDQRRSLLGAHAINNRSRLAAVLASDELATAA